MRSPSIMHSPSVRRFTIADGMILVPAAAVGALLLRSYFPGFMRLLGALSAIMPDPWRLWAGYSWMRGPGSCVVVPWMAALVWIRFRHPRPRRPLDQPGFVACIAVLASLVPGLLWYASIRHRPGFERVGSFEQVWSVVTHWTDTAVLGGWMALACAGRWRPESDWVDRMGRVLGSYWVAMVCGHLIALAASR